MSQGSRIKRLEAAAMPEGERQYTPEELGAMTISELRAIRDAAGPYKRDPKLVATFEKMTIAELEHIRAGGDPAPIFAKYGVTVDGTRS